MSISKITSYNSTPIVFKGQQSTTKPSVEKKKDSVREADRKAWLGAAAAVAITAIGIAAIAIAKKKPAVIEKPIKKPSETPKKNPAEPSVPKKESTSEQPKENPQTTPEKRNPSTTGSNQAGVLSANIERNLPEIKSLFKKVFNQDLTSEQATELARQYGEIFRGLRANPNDTTLLGKLHSITFKNMGFLNMPAKTINDFNAAYAEASIEGITLNTVRCANPEKLFNSLVHELKHMQQYRLMYATDKTKLLKAIFNRNKAKNTQYYRNLLQRCNGDESEAFNIFSREVDKQIAPEIKQVVSLQPSSPLYQKGMSYIENLANYHESSPTNLNLYNRYKNQLLEREAFEAGEEASRMFRLIMGA